MRRTISASAVTSPSADPMPLSETRNLSALASNTTLASRMARCGARARTSASTLIMPVAPRIGRGANSVTPSTLRPSLGRSAAASIHGSEMSAAFAWTSIVPRPAARRPSKRLPAMSAEKPSRLTRPPPTSSLLSTLSGAPGCGIGDSQRPRAPGRPRPRRLSRCPPRPPPARASSGCRRTTPRLRVR